MRSRSVQVTVLVVCLSMGWWPAAPAHAQSAVGGGPLTSSLADVEPTVGVMTLGPIKFAPGLTVRELGWDSNVFDEPPEEGPKEDYVAAAQPDVSAFTRLRFLRLSAYAGSELTYYHRYESERSIGHQVRGRADILLSRLRPFIAGGQTETRLRPNGEVDTRADRQEQELSGGIAFDLSSTSLVYASSFRASTTYENAFEDGIDLGDSLSRDGYNYQAGLKTDLTPLLSLQLFASYTEDRFKFDSLRNSESWLGTAQFRIAPDAVINGVILIAYRDMNFDDPGLKPYKGVVGTATVTYPFMEIGRLSMALSRGVEYSFDAEEGYYLEQTGTLTYTHRLFGQVDAQVRGTRGAFQYDARLNLPAHTDTLDTAGASLGYNLRNRTRVAVNYEYSRRRSPAFPDRNYERRRAYLSWQFAY